MSVILAEVRLNSTLKEFLDSGPRVLQRGEPMSKEENSFFQRCPHDRENPYSQINRDLIRDKSISPNCRWLLIYMLSMKDGWKMRASQIWEHTQEFLGRDKVRSIIKEAIEAGYIERGIHKEGNLNNGFYYLVSEFPKFKKCLRQTEIQAPEDKGPGQTSLSNSIYKEKALEVVCYPQSDTEKISSLGKENKIPSKSPEMKKSMIHHVSGKDVEVSLQDIFFQAIQNRKKWSTDEIHQAWNVLCQYKGLIGDSFKFIEGTIENIKRSKKSDFLAKGRGNRGCQKKERRESEIFKEKNSGEDTKEQTLVRWNWPPST